MKKKLIGMLTLFLVLVVHISYAQEKTISGTVTDDTGLPLPGVNVVVKNTNNGTQTDFDGKYSISANSGDVLVFSYVGFTDASKMVRGTSVIDVQMSQSAAELEEVVVVAYGAQSEKKLITSISKVSDEDIEDLVVDSPQSILQGQASGVQIVGSSGTLGSTPQVQIRGINSIGTNTRPLFVVDGVILGDSFQTAAQGGGQGLNPLASLNPNDISNISVLKSASAAALYGSRGANGVVLITTKKGSNNGKVSVNLDVRTSISQTTITPDLLNAEQYLEFSELIGTPRTDNGDDFDFMDAILNEAFSQTTNLSVSGGNQKSNYFFSATREDQEGVIIGNSLERTAFRANISTQAKDWLNTGINIAVNHNRFDRTPAENAFASPYTIGYLQRPDIAPIDADGNFSTSGNVGGGNVIAQEEFNINLATTTRITGNIFAEIDLSALINGLKFKQDVGADRNLTENQQREIEILTPDGFASNSVFQQNRLMSTSTLSYNKLIADRHNLSLLGGYYYEEDELRDIQVSGTGFLSDALINVESASTFPLTTAGTSESRLLSYFGRVNYDFDNGKYLLEGSFRRDGSSRFGVNERYGSFWAVSAGWNISDEGFMDDVKWVTGLKINGGIGTAGNDRVANFASLGTFFVSNYNGNSGLRPQSPIGNPDLTWETTTSYEIGLSASFFKERLSIGVEYYNKTTDGLILAVPVDPTFNNGLNSINDNVGELENRGVDVDISSTNIDSGNFKWTSRLNLGFNENEVTSLPEDNIDEQGNPFVAQGGGFSGQRAILGESANSFYLIRYVGVNAQTGDPEWLDEDGAITNDPLQSDRVVVGQANPDLVGGFTNTFIYKNWSLNTFFNFSFGNDLYVSTRQFTEDPLSSFNKTTRILNVWQQPGDTGAYIASPDSEFLENQIQDSSRFLEDGSFVRLKNITLSYTLPEEALKNIFVSSLRLYATGTNLITFKSSELDDIDPEITRNSDGTGATGEDFFGIPQFTTFTLGFNIGF